MAFQGDSIFWVETAKIVPNPYQPRREFDEARLNELAESIRMYGILQPLTVTRKEIQREDGTFYSEYELIAGERRLRAAGIAGVVQVPVIIRDGEQTEQEKLELAIIENLQREDLNAVDRALAFRQLADVFGLSHVQVGKKVGRSREYVSNSIRLLQLPDYMLSSLKQGDIAEGHARTLLMLNDRPEEQDTVYREVLLKKLSVRDVERIARKIATDKVRKKDWHGLEPELLDIERQLEETLGTRVQIVKTDYGGKVTIDYFSADDLAIMLGLLKQKQEAATRQSNEEEHMMSVIANATPLQTAEEEMEASPALDTETVESPIESSEPVVDAEPAQFTPRFVAQSVEHEPYIPGLSYIDVDEPVDVNNEPSVTAEVPENDSAEEEEVTLPEASDNQPASETKPEESDESTLYSIRNFSV